MVWDSEKCLEIIGLYEKKAERWQPDHKHSYNKLKKNYAWEEIAAKMGIPSEQLKRKLHSLRASHRRELTKEQTSKGTGKGK
jgi:Alcohol dehydrogenase transcription factor Myb/SANT-like.